MSKEYNRIPVKNNMNIEVDDSEEVVAPKEKKEMKKIVNSAPKKIKRGLFNRLVTGVLGPDGLPGIGTYVNQEIIIPSIKNIIFEAITSAASMAMYGERGGPRHHRGSGGRQAPYQQPRTNYNSSYRATQEPERKSVARPSRYGVEEYVIPDRFEAAHVLTTLTEAADRYDTVSVADYYDLIGAQTQFTDNNYGWSIDTITRATIVPIRGGFVIKFPPVEVL